MTAEQSFRFLARRLAFDYKKSAAAMVFTISPAEADGPAPLDSIMLASLLADEMGAKVLLVDSWFGPSRSVSDALGCENEPGLSQLLNHGSSNHGFLVRDTAQSGVSFLPRGPDLGEIDRSVIKRQLSDTLSSISTGFDFVLVVQNAVTGDTRGFEMISHCACAIILARDGVTRMVDIEDQEAALGQNSSMDVHVVLVLPEYLTSEEDEAA